MDARDRARADLTVRWTRAQPAVAAFIRSVVRDAADADDLLQETAYRVALRFDAFDPSRPFIAWAIGIARNCVLEWRRQRSRDPLVFDADTVERVGQSYIDRADELDRSRLAIERCLDATTPSVRRLLTMRYTDALKPAAIAERIGSTAASVSAVLYRARESLRECMRRKLTEDGE